MTFNPETPQTPLSLRDLYVDSNQAWSFIPPKPSNSTSGHDLVPTQYLYPNPKHSPTSVFSLSPSLSPSRPPSGLDYNEPERVPLPHIFKSLVASFILQYTSTAIVMPWEVGKLLLQVQWVPRDAGEVLDENEEGEKDLRDDVVSTVHYICEGYKDLS